MALWPEEADRILREKLRDGSTAAAISRYLVAEGYEKSRSAVIGRISRLGLRAAPGCEANSRRNKERAFRASRLKRDRDRGALPPSPVERAMPDPELPPVEDTVSLRLGECRWIADNGEGPKYCRARTVSLRSSWCHEHDARAHPSLARR